MFKNAFYTINNYSQFFTEEEVISGGYLPSREAAKLICTTAQRH